MTTDSRTASGIQALEEELSRLRGEPGYRNYRRVRDWVVELNERAPRTVEGVDRPSAYWLEELETLDFMLDASPLMIRKLRHHTYPVTGIRAYDYRTNKSQARTRFAEKLAALKELGGEDLLVGEPGLLGGFGHEIDGGLYNADTLKYYEALIALETGAVLGAFREPATRRLVCEVGSGWGGFPHAFKTLFPNVTYVLVDLPELFLFSGTYLLTAFPDAEILFFDPESPPLEEQWLAADFVLIANFDFEAFTPPQLDLMVNMVSFQEMTDAQIEDYVAKTHALGCPFIYSLNRERSLYNAELESVDDVLDRYYWINEVRVLPVNYMKMLPEGTKRGKKGAVARDELDYKHLIGRRRLEL